MNITPKKIMKHTLESCLSTNTTTAASTTSSTNGGENAPKLPPKPAREQARVIYPYKAANEDELTIKEGDIITIISKDNEDVGWWKGELNGRVALFPDNFVEIIKVANLSPATPPLDCEQLVRVKKPDRSLNSTVPVVTPTTTTTAAATPESPSYFKKKAVPAKKPLKVNDSGEESPKLISNNESEAKSSKLVHLTAQRPKIPASSRRPPSVFLSKDCDLIDDSDQQQQHSSDEAESSESDTEAVRPSSRGATGSEQVEQPKSSPDKRPPWVLELKKRQEKRKETENPTAGGGGGTPATVVPLATTSPVPTVNIGTKPIATTTTTTMTTSSVKPKPKSVSNKPSGEDQPPTSPSAVKATASVKSTPRTPNSPSTTTTANMEEFVSLKAELSEMRLLMMEFRKELSAQNETITGLNQTVCLFLLFVIN